MNFDPAGSGSDVLAMILGTPAFHEAHTDRAHLREFVDCLEAVVDGLAEQLGKLAVIEDLEGAAWRDFADGGRVEIVVIVALARLYKDTAV